MLIWNFHKFSHNLKTLFDVFLGKVSTTKNGKVWCFANMGGGHSGPAGDIYIYFFLLQMKKWLKCVERGYIWKKWKFQQKNLLHIIFQQNFEFSKSIEQFKRYNLFIYMKKIKMSTKKSAPYYLSAEFWIFKIHWTVQKIQFVSLLYTKKKFKNDQDVCWLEHDYMEMKIIVRDQSKNYFHLTPQIGPLCESSLSNS